MSYLKPTKAVIEATKAVEPTEEADEFDDKDGIASVQHIPQAGDIAPSEPPLELDPLSHESLKALRRLARHKAPKDQWPMVRRAAVMVLLFGGRSGQLMVLLSRRSSSMRTYPGEVALPGGKMEPSDLDLVYTARREAHEEVGLPINVHSVRHLCNLPPFLTRSNIIVTPVVCFLLDASLRPNLNPHEVEAVFAHPLEAFLYDQPKEPVLHALPPDILNGKKPYHLCYDIKWIHDKPYRMHWFETGKTKPIVGFTSDICIQVASLAFGKQPEFERRAEGQLRRRDILDIAIKESDIFDAQQTSKGAKL